MRLSCLFGTSLKSIYAAYTYHKKKDALYFFFAQQQREIVVCVLRQEFYARKDSCL